MTEQAAPAWNEPPETWTGHLTWHREAYQDSMWRWLPEHALSMALHYTRGRLEFTTLSDARALAEARRRHARDTESVWVQHADRVRNVQRVGTQKWDHAIQLCGLTQDQAHQLLWTDFAPPATPRVARQVRRVVSHFPWPNPLTEIWELQQLHREYLAVGSILDHAMAQLIRELARPLDVVAGQTQCGVAELSHLIETQPVAPPQPEQTY